MEVLYEDNHLIIVSKEAGEIVQGDKSGDQPLAQTVALYLKKKYNKPGDAFVGVVHRLDRPVSGIVIFAKTSKALARMNTLFREDQIKKWYHAIVEKPPTKETDTITHFLKKNEAQNKSYIVASTVKGSKEAKLSYSIIAQGDHYTLLEVLLHTGRHHQIRTQLSGIGSIIRGDLKYGARRSNPNGSISLHARRVAFTHPVSGVEIDLLAPYPKEDKVWRLFDKLTQK